MSDNSSPENERKQESQGTQPEAGSVHEESAPLKEEAQNMEETRQAAVDSTARAVAGGAEPAAPKTPEAPEAPQPATAEAEKSPAPESPGAWGQFFNGCAAAGPLMLFLVLAALVWGGFWKPGHGVYCPPESAFVTALLHCLDQNSWLAPAGLAGMDWTLPQWPVFYWLAWLLSLVPGMNHLGILLPTLSTIAAVIILLSVWSLGIAAGFGRRSAFAAGLIIICAPFFVPVAHFVGPMPMAAGLMLLSLAFFARGWRRRRAWLSLPLGFVFAALAGLCGGVVYLAVPLLASLCLLVWQARFSRAHAWDAVFGFALMLILFGGWLAWVTLAGPDNKYLASLFSAHMLFEWPPAPLWWRAILIGVAGILPWSLMIFTVSWGRVFAKSGASLKASRKDNASALIWTAIVWLCAASPFLPLPPDAGLPLIFLAAVLFGRAFMNLSPLGNRSFFLLAGIFVCALGAIVLAASFEGSREWLFALLPVHVPEFLRQALAAISSLYFVGILLLLIGLCAFFFAKSYQQGGGLIYGAIAAIAITQLAVFMIAPDLAALKHGKLLNLPEIEARVEAAAKAPGLTPPPSSAQPEPSVPALPQENGSSAAPGKPMPEQDAPAPVPTMQAPAVEVPPPKPHPAIRRRAIL